MNETSDTLTVSGTALQSSESEPRKLTRQGITITKRSNKIESKYTCRIRFRGKVHQLTLAETADESFKMAIRGRREIQAGRWAELIAATSLRGHCPLTLAALKTAYFAAPVEASTATRQQNWHALLQLLGDRDASAIDATLARQWFTAATTRIEAEPDQLRQASLKRSANSRFAQAASVFAPRALAGYKLAGTDCAAFEKFLAAGELYKFVRLPRRDYRPPSEQIIAATFEAWQKIEDRDLFLALGHELAFGLRAGEVVQARWNWWTIREGYPVLDGAAEVKSGTGRVSVRALDPWFDTLRQRIAVRNWRGEPDDYILSGHDTQRHDTVYRAASAWLRAQGWATQKTNHALRAYAGSQVAMRYGIYDAQTWLRHSSINVTEQHYSHFIKQFRPADVTAMPVRWATIARAFQPVVLPTPAQAG